MASTLTAILLGALTLPAVFAQTGPAASMAVKFANGLNVLDTGVNGGLNAVASSSYTKSKWAWGTVPKQCYDTATSRGYCNPYDIEVWNINYSDCNVTNVMCRCNNSPLTIDQVATDFGRVPVKARQWVNYVSSYPAASCSAYSAGNHLTLLGGCVGRMSVFFHEVAHSLDSWAVGLTGSAYSNTQEWKNIIAMGTCVADAYAKASWAESWAQVAVMSAYHFGVQSIWNLQVGCMADQMGKSIQQLDPLYKRVAGQTCNRSWAKDPSVCMGPAARDSGNCPNLRVAATGAGGVAVAGAAVATTASEESAPAGVTVEQYPKLSAEQKKAIEEEELARIVHAEEEAGLRKPKMFRA